ncbi:pfkB family kinase [Sclerotinia borealis F-4128]|uniref:PfkB family kinase n=1 Tax=Sclerotinia borealis (strain F-4128) TaxID=1432307 RepID=W9CFC0_SCLBF|nr:pfkB family kinase [Sclerotinia borealis F-4128]
MAEQSEKEKTKVEENRPLLTTLGMCILDDLYLPNGEIRCRVLGGSGVYSILGARLFLLDEDARRASWLIRAGDAFPQEIEERLQSWNTDLIIEKSQGCGVESKTYNYITGPYRIEPQHLIRYPQLLHSRTYHLLTSPLDTVAQVPELLHIRHQAGIHDVPLIVWEPLPPSCKPSELVNCMDAIGLVDIFSPNHIELAHFFGLNIDALPFSRSVIEDLGNTFLKRGIGNDGKGTIIIRCGLEGCCVWYCRQSKWVWIEPYWVGQEGEKKVIDATGAGNAFLGGFVVGWEKSGEDGRVGVPVLEKGGEERMEDRKEMWNGVDVRKRLDGYWKSLISKGVVEEDFGSYVWK